MRLFISATLLIAGVVHVLPLIGILGPTRLSHLYGVTGLEPNLDILLRHRAVLFGLLGSFLAWAAWVPACQGVAFVAAIISVGSFLVIVRVVGGANPQLDRVVVIDLVVMVLLIAGGMALGLSRREA